MEQQRAPLNFQGIDQQIEDALRRLRQATMQQNRDEVRATAARQGLQQAILPLQRQLAAELERRIVERRDQNSQTAALSPAQRRQREARLFSAALLELLPRMQKLIDAEMLATQHAAQAPPPTTDAGLVQAGLDALAAGDWLPALRRWARAGDPTTVVEAVQMQRTRIADNLLQQAHDACDRMYAVSDLRQRLEMTRILEHKCFRVVQRIGVEEQRERAQWLGLELEAAINGAPSAQPAVARHSANRYTQPTVTLNHRSHAGQSRPAAQVKSVRKPGRRWRWPLLGFTVLLFLVLTACMLGSFGGYSLTIQIGSELHYSTVM